jgi:hypothetical protein
VIGRERQEEILGRLAEAAKQADLYIAPIGSGYYFLQQPAGLETKDFDAVVHAQDLAVAGVDAVVTMAKTLGEFEVSTDRAVITVYLDGPKGGSNTGMVELVRGRARGNAAFLPRPLLEAAGEGARRQGRILWYPPEFVLVMKADAAADRQARADTGGRFASENQRRAETFRADVFREVQSGTVALDPAMLRKALSHIKKNRRANVSALIESASAGRINLQ